MCDFTPLKNWIITLGVFVGLATSSAVFALLWQRFGGIPMVTSISFGAAASWAAMSLVWLGFATAAANTFCECAASSASCATLCATLKAFLRTLLGALVGFIAICTVLATDPPDDWPLYGVLLIAWMAVLFAFSMVGVWANSLSRCQA